MNLLFHLTFFIITWGLIPAPAIAQQYKKKSARYSQLFSKKSLD